MATTHGNGEMTQREDNLVQADTMRRVDACDSIAEIHSHRTSQAQSLDSQVIV